MAETLLPDAVAERLHAFMLAAKTGSLTLHLSEGNVVKWELRESGHVAGRQKPARAAGARAP